MTLTRQKKSYNEVYKFYNKKDLVSISNTDNLALFIYPVFYVLEDMTIIRAILPFLGQYYHSLDK